MGLLTHFCVIATLAAGSGGGSPASRPAERRVEAGETWAIQDGQFHVNGKWVFLKTGKLIRWLEDPQIASQMVADVDILADRLNYNNFSINIYPHSFDVDADGKVDAEREKSYRQIARILDHCWQRGLFCCLSFETYNVGGGGIPPALFERNKGIVALNGLGDPARDLEYFGPAGKLIPSINHPEYLEWSRRFLVNFLRGLGKQRVERLLYVETTVEPQYLGQCNFLDKDERRAFLDFSEAASTAFAKWQARLPAGDPGRDLQWPKTQEQRDALLGNKAFNRFRGQTLAEWINGDIAAIRSVAPSVYIAVDFNGRFDDPHDIRLGDHGAFLAALTGVDIIQIAPHTPEPWGSLAWDEVRKARQQLHRTWAVSEHMTATGDWAENDRQITRVLENTLEKGTKWGWEFVNASNARSKDRFCLYEADWTSPILDVIEKDAAWDQWLAKIGATRFAPTPRISERAADVERQ